MFMPIPHGVVKIFILPFVELQLKYRGPSFWNHLDPVLKTKITINTFKRELKKNVNI